jgi:dTDP-4-amino-4,6-dideoxygalactose transaminase
VPEECGQGYHLFYVLMPTATERNDALDSLRAQGVSATFHYLPLHLSDVGRRFGYIDGDLPVTESVSERLLRLPFYNGLTEADQGRVIAAVERL